MNQHAISYSNRYVVYQKCVPYHQIKSSYAPVPFSFTGKQKAVSDLSNKTSHLQAQESALSTQIKDTSAALDKHPDKKQLLTQDCKCNVVVCGIDECLQNTS